jgi:5-methylcytosine-specific restriction endonuclease McrA
METNEKDSLIAKREKNREKSARYHKANREKIRERKRLYREANREKKRERDRRYYEANREKRRESARLYREANREKVRAHLKRYREANRDKVYERQARRRAILLAAKVSDDAKYIYWYCARLRRWGLDVEVDHIVPLARGGDHVAANLQIITAEENQRKGDRLDYVPDVVYPVPANPQAQFLF